MESHFDYYRPVAETKPGLPQDGAFYGLGVHTMDQIISLFGRPDHVAYDIRSLRNKANPDDTFEAQLFYGDLKAIVKTSHLVKIDYPKFIVHGKKGSFIKYGIDQQETSLKANIMPGEPGFAADDSVGVLEYVNDEGVTVREEMKPEMAITGAFMMRCIKPSPTVRQITSRNLKFLPIWKSLNEDLSKPLPPQ